MQFFLAGKTSCKLLILHDSKSSYNHRHTSKKASDRIAKIAEENLQEIKNEIKNNPDTKDVECETRLIHTNLNSLVDVVNESLKKDDTDLIVMGTKGASGVNKILIGSNTVNIIKKVACPVLAIPENSKFQPIKRIMFASDYKKVEILALKLVRKIAITLNAAIDFVSINKYVRETLSKKKGRRDKQIRSFFRKRSKTYF